MAALLLATDWELYQNRWFLRHVGHGTQEGQILDKMERASSLAEVADVVFFGSSTVRSNISSRPFLDRGIVPLNLGVSGGGPIYSYYALKGLAPILSHRTDKPVMVLEISCAAVLLASQSEWSEYEQLFSIVRSRAGILEHGPLLYQNFLNGGSSSLFLSTALLPSLMYRVHTRTLGSYSVRQIGNLFMAEHGENDSFYGPDDQWGYAPLYGEIPFDKQSLLLLEGKQLRPSARISEPKVEFLRMSIELARTLGIQVVLLESAMNYPYPSLDSLLTDLQKQYPDVRVIRSEALNLHPEDYSDGGHLNIWGADHLSTRLATELLPLADRTRRAAAEALMVESLPLPPAVSWEVVPDAAATDGPSTLMVRGGSGEYRVGATSPVIELKPGDHYVFEFVVNPLRGQVGFEFGPPNPSERESGSSMAYMWTVDHFPPGRESARFYLRFTPRASRAVLRLVDMGKADGTRVILKGLYRNR